MKHITTKKAIVNEYGNENIICVPYCALQDLLCCHNATEYTSGVYGWNADIYRISGAAICTGYRPFGGIKPAHEICKRYNDAARDMRVTHIEEVHAANLDAEETYDALKALRRELRNLAEQFVREVYAATYGV